MPHHEQAPLTADRWRRPPTALAVLLLVLAACGCRAKASDGQRQPPPHAPDVTLAEDAAEAVHADAAGPGTSDAPGVVAAETGASAPTSADTAATGAQDAAPPEVSAPDTAADPDIGESAPCDPSLPAEVVALRNAEDRALRLDHARYAVGRDVEEDFCVPGASCPEPLIDLNADGRPEYRIDVGYCDSSSWWLVASTPEGYVKVLSDGEGSTELLTPRLRDGRRVVVLSHDCCCQSHVSVSQILPSGEVEDLYLWVSECGACYRWIDEQYEAGRTDVGTGAYQALPEIVDDVLLGVREPEDCSGRSYRKVDVATRPPAAGAVP